MENNFSTKVVIVTGASFGIGRATALAFAKRGAKVVIADYIKDNETLNSIKSTGGEAIFIKCDVSKAEEVRNLINQTVNTYGRLDYAVNNAGIEGTNAVTHECTEEIWDRTININLKGVWLCMKYEIEQMLKQGGGAIVNISSIASQVGFAGLPAYVASKHGVNGLTKNAALEYSKLGIRVNVICPGVIKTPMVDRTTGNNAEVEKQFEAAIPMNRMGKPEEIAEAAVWLCSDAATYVTAGSLIIDGGWTAQ